jgi:hypothetical protein
MSKSASLPNLLYSNAQPNFTIFFDGQGFALQPNSFVDFVVPISGNIIGWTIISGKYTSASDAVVISTRKCNYSQYDAGVTHPATGDAIDASSPIQILAGNTKNTDTVLSGWTKSVTQNDIIRFVVTSCTNINNITIYLKIQR